MGLASADLAVCCQSEPPGVNQPESSWEEALVHLSLLFWYNWKEFPIQKGTRGRLHTQNDEDYDQGHGPYLEKSG
ncbi:hypothetical protein CRENBAI_000321 [Crenichthys baileyi]|uniref:Uncharacterized protein n=1 Tax=Crenichthys baileyi TaxID=28760 RepID=A0AAV9SJW2_9TELE